MYIGKIADDWKEIFGNLETPRFYAYQAIIEISILCRELNKSTIQILDEKKNEVMKISTCDFAVEMGYVDCYEDGLRIQDFSQLTQPITFSGKGISAYLNNCGCGDWYEIIVSDEEEDDCVAKIYVRKFLINLT